MSNDVTPQPPPPNGSSPAVPAPAPATPARKRPLTLLIQRLQKILTPEVFNPKFSFLALIAVPLIVFGLHALFNSGMMVIRHQGDVVVPDSRDSGDQVVFAARLGDCAEKGAKRDGARGVFMPAMLTVWVRNFDGWLMDRAEGNETLLKDSGFTPASYRSYLSLRFNTGRVQSAEQEAAFRTWLRKLIGDTRVVGKPGIPAQATLEQMFKDADVQGQNVAKPDLLPVNVTPSMSDLQDVLKKLVK